MKSLQARQVGHLYTGELRRILAVLVLMLTTGIAWRLILPSLVDALARGSVGGPGRGSLLAEALRHRGYNIPSDEWLFDAKYPSEFQGLRTHSLPAPGWIACRRPSTPHASWFDPGVLDFYDNRLCFKGSICMQDLIGSSDQWAALASPPSDYDGDGLWEVLVRYDPAPERREGCLSAYAVVRLSDQANEILLCCIIDCTIWGDSGPHLRPVWQDREGEGTVELVFRGAPLGRPAPPGGGPQPPAAVFAWDSAGKTMQLRLMPESRGIAYRLLAPGETAPVPADLPIAPSLRGLLVPPAGG